MIVIDSSRLLLAFRVVPDLGDLKGRLRGLGLLLEDDDEAAREQGPPPIGETVNHTHKRYWVRTVTGKRIDQKRYEAIQQGLDPALDWIGPVYRLANSEGRGGLVCPLP